MMQFDKYGMVVQHQSKLISVDRSAHALDFRQLIADPTPVNRAELFWRISLPIMSLLLLFLAIPLGFVNPRVGRSANVIAALLLVTIYILSVNIVQSSIQYDKFAFARAWWPIHVLVGSAIAALFVWRSEYQ